MVKRIKNPAFRRTSPYYSLGEVKRLVKSGDIIIREETRKTALKDFGWDSADISNAFKKLQQKHFYKTENAYFIPDLPIDYYKAYGLMGEDVYIHFYIDKETNKLMVDSFKKI